MMKGKIRAVPVICLHQICCLTIFCQYSLWDMGLIFQTGNLLMSVSFKQMEMKYGTALRQVADKKLVKHFQCHVYFCHCNLSEEPWLNGQFQTQYLCYGGRWGGESSHLQVTNFIEPSVDVIWFVVYLLFFIMHHKVFFYTCQCPSIYLFIFPSICTQFPVKNLSISS